MSNAYKTEIFVLDCSRTMGRIQTDIDDGVFPPRDLSSLEIGLQFIETKIRKAMATGGTTSRAAFILFGCDRTDNWLASGGTDGYDGIVDLVSPETVNDGMIRKLRRAAQVSSTESDMLSAMILGVNVAINAFQEGKVCRNVELIVISDLECEINWSDQQLVVDRFTGLGKQGNKEIVLRVVVPGYGKDVDYAKPPKNEDGTRPMSTTAKSAMKKDNEKYMADFVDLINEKTSTPQALLGNARNALAAVRSPPVPTTKSRADSYSLTLGDPNQETPLLRFDVQMFKEIHEAKHASMKKLSLLKRPVRSSRSGFIPPPRKAWGSRSVETSTTAPTGSNMLGHDLGGSFGGLGSFGGGGSASTSSGSGSGTNDPLLAWYLREVGSMGGDGGASGISDSQTQSLNAAPQTFDVDMQRRLFIVRAAEEDDEEDGGGGGDVRSAEAAKAAEDELAMEMDENLDVDEDDEPAAAAAADEPVPQNIQDTLETAYKLGKTYISDVDKESFFLSESPGRIEILQSIRIEAVNRFHLLDGYRIVFADPSSSRSQVGMSALIDAMAQNGRALIVRLTSAKVPPGGDTTVRLGLLQPYQEIPDDINEPVIMGMRFNHLAFADDARYYSGFRSLDNLYTVGGNKVESSALIPSEKLEADMDAFCESMRIDHDDAGQEIDIDDLPENPLKLFNPSLRAVENAVMIRLDNPSAEELPPPHHSILECIKPAPRLLKRSRAIYEGLATEAGATKVPPKEKRGKGQKNISELVNEDLADGLDAPGPSKDGHAPVQPPVRPPASSSSPQKAIGSGGGMALGNFVDSPNVKPGPSTTVTGNGSKDAPMDIDEDATEDEDEEPPAPRPRPSTTTTGQSQSQSQRSQQRVKISTDFPVKDFQAKWAYASTGEHQSPELQTQTWRAFVDAIVQMVAKSFGWSRYHLAIEALVFAREWALDAGYVNEYAQLIQALRAEHHVDGPETPRMRKKNFWRHVVNSEKKLAPFTAAEADDGQPEKVVQGLMEY